MPLQIKPHTVTVRLVTQSMTSNSVLGNPARGASSAAIACLCVPMKPQEAFARFQAVLTDVWTIYLEVADATSFSAGAEILFDGETLVVQGDVEMHANGDPADCAIVYAMRLMSPEAA